MGRASTSRFLWAAVAGLMLAGCPSRDRATLVSEPGTLAASTDEPEPEPERASAPSDKGCPADPPEPAAKPRPSRPRPFINVLSDEDVPLTRSLPPADVRFGSVVCKGKHEVWRDEQGRVRVCTVAARVTVMGIDIAAGAYTHFHEDGRAYQTTTAKQQELTTAKGVKVLCAADLVVLGKTGLLEHCDLAAPVTIGNVPCRPKESIGFHSNGALSLAVVDRPTEVGGVALPAGTRVYWYESGKVAGTWLPEPTRVQGILVRWDVALHENGRLRAFTLAEAKTLSGQELPEGAKVELRPDGTLKYAEYVTKRGFMPHGEMWTDTKHVRYDCEGKVLGEYTDHWQADRPPPRLRR